MLFNVSEEAATIDVLLTNDILLLMLLMSEEEHLNVE